MSTVGRMASLSQSSPDNSSADESGQMPIAIWLAAMARKTAGVTSGPAITALHPDFFANTSPPISAASVFMPTGNGGGTTREEGGEQWDARRGVGARRTGRTGVEPCNAGDHGGKDGGEDVEDEPTDEARQHAAGRRRPVGLAMFLIVIHDPRRAAPARRFSILRVCHFRWHLAAMEAAVRISLLGIDDNIDACGVCVDAECCSTASEEGRPSSDNRTPFCAYSCRDPYTGEKFGSPAAACHGDRLARFLGAEHDSIATPTGAMGLGGLNKV
eukprot:7376432-Prymnesium_polylepis.2